MLRLPGDSFVTIEVVTTRPRAPSTSGTGIHHLVVQAESVDAPLVYLADRGIAAEPPALPTGTDGPRTTWITDADDYRIELVHWPPGHADGITEADFP